MFLQVTLILVLQLTYINGTPPAGYKAKPPEHDANPPKYEYGYNIADEKGTGQGKMETRDGIYALGRYYVQGSTSSQSVEYLADDWGFHPLVQYSSVGPHSKSITQIALGAEAVNAFKNGNNDIFDPKLSLTENIKKLHTKSTENQNKVKESIRGSGPSSETAPTKTQPADSENQLQNIQPIMLVVPPQAQSEDVLPNPPVLQMPHDNLIMVPNFNFPFESISKQQPIENTNHVLLLPEPAQNLPSQPIFQTVPQTDSPLEHTKQNQIYPEEQVLSGDKLRDDQKQQQNFNQLLNENQSKNDLSLTQNGNQQFQSGENSEPFYLQPQPLVQVNEQNVQLETLLPNAYNEEQYIFESKKLKQGDYVEKKSNSQRNYSNIKKDSFNDRKQSEDIKTYVKDLTSNKNQHVTNPPQPNGVHFLTNEYNELQQNLNDQQLKLQQVINQQIEDVNRAQYQEIDQKNEDKQIETIVQQSGNQETTQNFELEKMNVHNVEVDQGNLLIDSIKRNPLQPQFILGDFFLNQPQQPQDMILFLHPLQVTQNNLEQIQDISKVANVGNNFKPQANGVIDLPKQVNVLTELQPIENTSTENISIANQKVLQLHQEISLNQIVKPTALPSVHQEIRKDGEFSSSKIQNLEGTNALRNVLLTHKNAYYKQPTQTETKYSQDTSSNSSVISTINELTQFNTEALYESGAENFLTEDNRIYDKAKIETSTGYAGYGSKISTKLLTHLSGLNASPVNTFKSTSSKLIESTRDLVNGLDVLRINDALDQSSEDVESSTTKQFISENVHNEIYNFQNNLASTTQSPIAILSLLTNPIVVADYDDKANDGEVYSTTQNTLETIKSDRNIETTETTVVVTPRPSSNFLAPITAGIRLQNVESTSEPAREKNVNTFLVDVQKSVPYYVGKYEYLQNPSVVDGKDGSNSLNVQTAITNLELGKALLNFPLNFNVPKPEPLIWDKSIFKNMHHRGETRQDVTNHTIDNFTSDNQGVSTSVSKVTDNVLQQTPVGKVVENPLHIEVTKYIDRPYAVHVPVAQPVAYPVARIIEKYINRPYPVPVHIPVQVPIHIERQVPVPYPVEKIVEKPITKIVEKKVPVPQPYPVEKIVEKPVQVPVEVTKYVDRPYPVHVQVDKPYPVEKIVEKIVNKPYPVEVRIPVQVPVEVPIPQPVHIEKIVERKVPIHVHVPLPVAQAYVVPIEVPTPYPVQIANLLPQGYNNEPTYQVPPVPQRTPVHLTKYHRPSYNGHQHRHQYQYYYYPNPHASNYQTTQNPIASQDTQPEAQENQVLVNYQKLQSHQHPYAQYSVPQQNLNTYTTIQQKPYVNYEVPKYHEDCKPLNKNHYIGLVPPKVANLPRKNRQAMEGFDHNPKMEYGFFPPLVPSLEIDENGNPIETNS